MGFFEKNKERDIYIKSTNEKVITLVEKVGNLEKSVSEHERSNDREFNSLLKEIVNNKCPHANDDSIEEMKEYNKQQNGHIKAIEEKLAAIANETIGEEKVKRELKEKEKASIASRNLYIALTSCMLVGIGIFVTMFMYYKTGGHITPEQLDQIISSIKK